MSSKEKQDRIEELILKSRNGTMSEEEKIIFLSLVEGERLGDLMFKMKNKIETREDIAEFFFLMTGVKEDSNRFRASSELPDHYEGIDKNGHSYIVN
jgi:hypothetical protein